MKYHYVYRITNIIEQKHYYGSRTSRVNPELDLGIIYFSSSRDKDFIIDQKENPKNYRYKIIKISETKIDNQLLEIKLHHKLDVRNHKSFYNNSNQTNTGFTSGNKYCEHCFGKFDLGNFAQHHGKYCKENTNRILKPKQICKYCNRTFTDGGNLSKHERYHCSENLSREILIVSKYKSQDKLKCPYCDKVGSQGNMKRYHFENCKLKSIS